MVRVCMFACIPRACERECKRLSVRVRLPTCVRVCTFIYVYGVRAFISVCARARACVCVCVYVCVCMMGVDGRQRKCLDAVCFKQICTSNF